MALYLFRFVVAVYKGRVRVERSISQGGGDDVDTIKLELEAGSFLVRLG